MMNYWNTYRPNYSALRGHPGYVEDPDRCVCGNFENRKDVMGKNIKIEWRGALYYPCRNCDGWK